MLSRSDDRISTRYPWKPDMSYLDRTPPFLFFFAFVLMSFSNVCFWLGSALSLYLTIYRLARAARLMLSSASAKGMATKAAIPVMAMLNFIFEFLCRESYDGQ